MCERYLERVERAGHMTENLSGLLRRMLDIDYCRRLSACECIEKLHGKLLFCTVCTCVSVMACEFICRGCQRQTGNFNLLIKVLTFFLTVQNPKILL